MRLISPVKIQLVFCSMLCIILCSCKHSNREMLLGKWHSVKIENRDKDNFFRSSKQFIDTMGKGNDDTTNMAIYGATNMDSLRHELQAQYDSAYAAQLSIDTQSIMTFKNDSTVIFSFPGKNETGKWHLDKNGKLVLDETNELGETQSLNVEITEISETALKLTFMRELEEGLTDTSVVSFRKE